jgi:hypothetical protein
MYHGKILAGTPAHGGGTAMHGDAVTLFQLHERREVVSEPSVGGAGAVGLLYNDSVWRDTLHKVLAIVLVGREGNPVLFRLERRSAIEMDGGDCAQRSVSC